MPEAFVATNDDERTRKLSFAIVSLEGFRGPIDLLRCAYVPDSGTTLRHIVTLVTDASSPDLVPLEPLPVIAYRFE